MHWLIAYILLVRNAGSGCKFCRIAQDVKAGSFCARSRNGGRGAEKYGVGHVGKNTVFHAEKKFPFENNQIQSSRKCGIKPKAGVQTGVQTGFRFFKT